MLTWFIKHNMVEKKGKGEINVHFVVKQRFHSSQTKAKESKQNKY